jgi:hypothetical protein
MAYDFQVVIDAADPHALADWWAEAMRWQVEASDEDFIRRMIAEGQATEADATTHRGVLVWTEGAAIRPPAGHASGPGRRILFQLVPEPKSGKNRAHLDVWVGAENVAAEQDRLVGIGARFLHTGRQGPHSWVTLADPEGNEFCLA